jgi:hypothetical protein
MNITSVAEISDSLKGAEITGCEEYSDGFHITLQDGRVIVCVASPLIVYVGKIVDEVSLH